MSAVGQIMAIGLPLLAVLLPTVFSKRRWLRTVVVIVLLANLLCVFHFGLRLAARNVPLPPQETLRGQVVFADAWNEGRLATQKQVNAYRLNLLASCIALAVLALVPRPSKS